MTDRTHEPQEQIRLGNPWYVEDQLKIQMGHPGSRAVILNRWRVFEDALAQWLGDRVRGSVPVRILDAGCGDGINVIGLGRIVQRLGIKAEIYAVDYNPLRVDRVAELPGVKEAIQARLDTLPYSDGYFDVVLCNHVIEHIQNDKAVIEGLRRVISGGGLLIVGVPNEGCLMGRLRNRVVQRSVMRKTDHVHFHTADSLADLVLDARFKLVTLARYGFLTPHGAAHYLLTGTRAGRLLLNAIGGLFPSQCADLILVAKRRADG